MNAEPVEIATVRAWHDALNGGDHDALTALMHDDIEFAGPRGSGRGIALVLEWAKRSGIQLEPRRWSQQEDVVAVAQQARWRDPETGAPGEPHAIASVFTLRDGRIARVARYDTLTAALSETGIDDAAEVLASNVTDA